jgi:hypothetical protein
MACLDIVYENESAVSYVPLDYEGDGLGRGDVAEMEPLLMIRPP